MRRRTIALAAVALVAALLPAAAGAHPDELSNLPAWHLPGGELTHSHDEDSYERMSLVGNWVGEPVGQNEHYREGTDLAFWGNRAIAGHYVGGFHVLDIAGRGDPRLIGQFRCDGAQSDVSIWQDLVFVSVDSAQGSSNCRSGDEGDGQRFEGIRIVSIADPSAPEQLLALNTPCGSHTHTLVPDEANGRVLIYVSSYPLGAPTAECNPAGHRKISVVEVPLDEPAAASIVSSPDVSPAIGCHDITVLPHENLAAAACISESQLWNISDPANPVVLSHIRNPAMEIHHSSAFAWDGDTLVLGDEMGGAAAAAGCFTGGHAPTGSLWFYDVSDPASPQMRSHYTIPQNEDSLFCTAHNFNVVPTRDGRDVLVTAWYNGGTHILDFSDPADVKPLAHAIPGDAAAWSSYWYNDLVYANHFDESYQPSIPRSRGVDVYAVDGEVFGKTYHVSWLNPQTQTLPPAMAAQQAKAARTSR